MAQKHLLPSILLKICEFASDPCYRSEKNKRALSSIVNKAANLKSKTHHLDQREIFKQIRSRLEQAQRGRVDLSHCGLYHLQQASDYQALFALIPSEVHTLNLRANQFKTSSLGLKALQAGLKFLPRQVRYLDLSDNGFDLIHLDDLKMQFSQLPASLAYLALSHERPLALKDHIQRKNHPQYYPLLLAYNYSLEDKLKILLLDYTQANSRFRRLMCGFWNRQHLAEVNRILIWMAHGYLTHIQDILEHLNTLQMVNNSGSLAQISHFMYSAQHQPKQQIRVQVMP